ncbi:cytochrome oxidase putative small subunit CydP [Undibacterium sp.]|uniref:cytochrome oxidase putative small subunit CydP n=1 Tax=Undibacterium sp. TaxID=1914977 RepID=UPI002C161465|nr:cytochrome oxidase putative small subunit CydP [Undibacterium sp.]HTD05009.1 hypothetical protein [Undibacterium sp.]
MRLNRFSLSSLYRRWPRFTRLPLALEITLALLLKILILTLLWKFFFAHPQVKKMRMPLPQVEQHLLAQNAEPVAPAASEISKTTDKGSP